MQRPPNLELVENNGPDVLSREAAIGRLRGEFRIGPVRISPATVLAPMAGVTDTVFRRLIRHQGGCGLLMTEFTSSHGVVNLRKAKKPNRNFRYLYFEPE